MNNIIKSITPKQERAFTVTGSIMLVIAILVNLFSGFFGFSPVKAQETTPSILLSYDGSNSIPAQYVPVNNAYVNGKPLACFDFHIFAETFNSAVHTHGNIAVEKMGTATEFGFRKTFDVDVPNISYIGNTTGWLSASVADSFVFGPNIKISSSGSQIVINNATLDSDGNPTVDESGNIVYNNESYLIGNGVGDVVYSSYNQPKYLDIAAELDKATEYAHELFTLAGDVEYGIDDISSQDGSEYELNLGGTVGDTVVVSLTAEELKSVTSGIFNINNASGKRVIFNIDMSNADDAYDLGITDISIDGESNREGVCELDCNVLWNFYAGDTGAYTGEIIQRGIWMGTILAPKAALDVAAVNGSMIAKSVTTHAETHKWDYTGETVILDSIDFAVRKLWIDHEDNTVTHPDVTVNLLQNGTVYDTHTFIGTECDAESKTEWTHVFENLPVVDENGNTYQYRVEEVITEEIANNYNSVVAGHDIINKFNVNEEVKLRISKYWVGQNSNQTLRFNVYQNGELLTTVERSMQNNGEVCEVSIPNTTLYKYSPTGALNVYTIEEESIDGYVVSDVTTETSMNGNAVRYTYIFENTKLDDTKGVIKVDKTVASQGSACAVTDMFYVSLFDSSNTLVETKSITLNSESSSSVVFSNVEPGQYYVRETQADGNELPAGFGYEPLVSNNGSVNVTAGATASVSITNEIVESSVTATVEVIKYDNFDSAVLPGAEIGLFDDATNEQISSTYSQNGTGIVSFANIPVGEYYLKELSAPSGYELNETKYYFSVGIADNGSTITTLYAGSTDGEPVSGIPNTRQVGTITLVKTNADGSLYLSGAEFDLYKDGQKYNTTPLVTDANGQLIISGLEWGSYYFVETLAPTGYQLNDSISARNIVIGESSLDVTLTVTNAELVEDVFDPSSLSGAKGIKNPAASYCENDILTYYITVMNNSAVASGEFSVTDTVPDGTSLYDSKEASVTDNLLVWTVDNLEPGESVTVEFDVKVSALADGVYSKDITNTAYVNDVATNVVTTVVKKGVVHVYFVDESGNKLADEVVYEGTPGTEHGYTGPISIPDYELVRTDSNDITGDFIEGVITVTHVYKPITGSLVIESTNADGSVFLPETKYELYKDGVKYGDNVYTTGSDGKIEINNLPVGTYTLVEVQEPDGYLRAETPADTYFATISAESHDGKITVPHSRVPVESIMIEKFVSLTGKDNDWSDEVTATAGSKVFFKIRVTNNGETEIDLSELLLTDTFKLNDEAISTDIWSSQLSNDAFTGVLDINECWESGVMSYDTSSTLSSNDKYYNTAAIGDESDGVTVNIKETEIEPTAHITVSKTAAIQNVAAGNTVEYTVVVSNTGETDLTNIIVKDSLKGSWVIDASSENISLTADGDILINSIKAGDAPVTLKYQYTVPSDTEDNTTIDNAVIAATSEVSATDIETITVTASSVSDSDVAPDDSNDDSEEDDESLGKGNPSYSVKKIANASTARPGDTIYYTLIVTNTGDCSIHDLEISDTTLNWSTTISSLAVGASWTSPNGVLSYTIPASFSGNLKNTVVVNNEYLPETSESFTVKVLGATDTNGGSSDVTNGTVDNDNSVPDTQDRDAKNITCAFTILWTSAAMVLVLIPFMVRRKVRRSSSR